MDLHAVDRRRTSIQSGMRSRLHALGIRNFRDPVFLPEVRFLGLAVFTPTRPHPLRRHSHRHWEICYLASGAMDWWSEGRLYSLRSGDCFFNRPNEVHSGWEAALRRCAICYVSVAMPPEPGALPGMPAELARIIGDGFRAIPMRSFRANTEVEPAFLDLLESVNGRDPFRGGMARAALQRLLMAVLRSYSASDAKAHTYTPAIERALAALAQSAVPLPIVELARLVGLQRSRLHERFVAEVGMSPQQYHVRLRIERAKRLLIEGRGNVEIAAATGFSSSQHFGSVFKRQVGATPAAWKKRESGGTG
jgi:AraC-like DNA-binding protein